MDDLIRRQAAIDALNEYFARIGKLKRRGLTKGEKAISLDTVGAIKTLPSAQQDCTDCPDYDTERHSCPKYCEVIRRTLEEAKQERTGQWMATEADEPCFYRCSECGRLIDERENFCPNCGARMEDETNG